MIKLLFYFLLNKF